MINLSALAASFCFLCGWFARDILGKICIRGALKRIETKLDIVAHRSQPTAPRPIAPQPPRPAPQPSFRRP